MPNTMRTLPQTGRPRRATASPHEGHDERDRVERVAIAVLEPAAPVVEQARHEDGNGGQAEGDRHPRPPVRPQREEQPRAGQEDRHAETVGSRRDEPLEPSVRLGDEERRKVDEQVVEVRREVVDREQARVRARAPGTPAATPAHSPIRAGDPNRAALYQRKNATAGRIAARVGGPPRATARSRVAPGRPGAVGDGPAEERQRQRPPAPGSGRPPRRAARGATGGGARRSRRGRPG